MEYWHAPLVFVTARKKEDNKVSVLLASILVPVGLMLKSHENAPEVEEILVDESDYKSDKQTGVFLYVPGGDHAAIKNAVRKYSSQFPTGGLVIYFSSDRLDVERIKYSDHVSSRCAVYDRCRDGEEKLIFDD